MRSAVSALAVLSRVAGAPGEKGGGSTFAGGPWPALAGAVAGAAGGVDAQPAMTVPRQIARASVAASAFPAAAPARVAAAVPW